MSTPYPPFARHSDAVRAIAVFPDGNRIVTGGEDGALRVWDARSGQLVAEHLESNEVILAVAAMDEARIVACTRTKTLGWNIATNRVSPNLHRASIAEAAVSPTGAVLAFDRQFVVAQLPEGAHWPAQHTRIDGIAVSANGAVVTAGAKPLLRITDSSGEEIDRLDHARAQGEIRVASSANASRIGYVTRDGVYCWDRLQRGRASVRLPGCPDPETVVVTSDGGQIVAGDSAGGLWAWTLGGRAEPEPLRMRGHDSAVLALATTPDRMRLVSGAKDGTVRVWDLTNGAEFSPNDARSYQPGLANDEANAVDLLGFGDDVNSLAGLITDRETKPPLAISLLGRWGSGKSSFMRQLENSIDLLARQGRLNPARSVFSTSVRQVRFDAWHYNDDHVWVGIVEQLFRNLAESDAPDPDDVRTQRNALRERLRHLEQLNDPEAPTIRRLGARLRLWIGNLRRLAWPIVTIALGTGAGVLWWLSIGPLPPWILGIATVVLGTGAVGSVFALLTHVRDAWDAIRDLRLRRTDYLSAAVRDTTMRLARLDAAHRLALAIEEARVGKYEQYRGLLGHVHDDLRKLSDSAQQAFAEWDASGRPNRTISAGTPPLERIILYIDDLDRCSPRVVVDVLAAVHLLLAVPLFVVVVAVDPRWLRRCLERYHTDLFGEHMDDAEVATPLDYLDKIFQVVFGLRPMGNEAERLVAGLVTTEISPSPGRDEPQGDGEHIGGPTGSHGAALGNSAAGMPSSAPNPQPEQLRVRAEELAFMQRLQPMLRTPRLVKRFTNLYRLVRAPIPNSELDEFIGDEGTGPYQSVLVLLAVLVASPASCRELILTLREADRETTLVELIQQFGSGDPPSRFHGVWNRLLHVIATGDPIHDKLTTYRDWAGTIARFSFETWDLTEPR